ncbi:ras-related protein Rab21 [Trypanosoma theileri]|uniref:Ras-related protein Rab21 n=1 Tax=Trypanosoma theileri TaxID=67003 RepID=A0A1X0NRC4_9TRYP|nr:ras-related protein Rab21 [Trypanosoma theileri]ORC87266.1 ras-related protein Rab21 [Trypanosoma theileri]
MLGEGRVGKTSLLQRFVNNSFDDDCSSTTKASMYANVKIDLSNGTVAVLSIWDTAGQERYHALGPIYYRDAHGAVLLYDITDYESFLKVKIWLKELQEVVGSQNISVVIVGNKIDLERERRVPVREAEDWARQQNAKHFIVSAKLGIRVAEPFEAVAANVVDRIEKSSRIVEESLKPVSDGMTSKMPVRLGVPPPRSRGVKINLNETSDDYVSPAERHCSC